MLAMDGAFAFMGGVAGFCLGAWYLQKERWMAEKLESERRFAEIEAVIASLQSLTEISTVKYTTEGQARMIDLQMELESRLTVIKEIKEIKET